MIKFSTKGTKTIAKKGRKIVAFAGFSNGSYFYAFGSPSQSTYIAFNVDSIDTAKKKIIENI